MLYIQLDYIDYIYTSFFFSTEDPLTVITM